MGVDFVRVDLVGLTPTLNSWEGGYQFSSFGLGDFTVL